MNFCVWKISKWTNFKYPLYRTRSGTQNNVFNPEIKLFGKKRSQIQYCVTNWSLKTGYIYWTIFFIINQVVSWWCTLVVRKIAHFLLCNQFTQWGKKRLWNRNRIWIWILYHFYCNVLKSSSFFDKTYEFVKATKIHDKIFQWIWSLQKQTNGMRLSQNIWTLMNCTIWINFVQNIP